MGEEPRLAALADVFLHAVAGKSDAPSRIAVADLPHQLEPAAVGESDIADDQVEVLRGRSLECGGEGIGGLHNVGCLTEQRVMTFRVGPSSSTSRILSIAGGETKKRTRGRGPRRRERFGAWPGREP